MTHLYVLKGQDVVPAKDVFEWATFFEDFTHRRVAYTDINADTYVSTVFLGIDHDHGSIERWGTPSYKPLVFETMVFRRLPAPKAHLFGGEYEFDGQEQWRWRTYRDAEHAHAFIVARLMENPSGNLSDYEPLPTEMSVA